jgi:branched-chain amino acid transport system substrate-binding protein
MKNKILYRKREKKSGGLKMKKRWLVSLVVFILSVVVGCSSDDVSSEKPAIKIGANLELTGKDASQGQSVLEGIELAIDQINKNERSGYELLYNLELIKEDNQSDAAEAKKKAEKLVKKDKVSAIIGAATNENTLAQVDIAEENKIILLTPTGTAPAITQKGDYEGYEYIFRTSYAQPLQGSIASNFAGVSAQASKAAVLFDSTNDQSKLLATSFIDAFQLTGGEIVGNESYESISTDDLQAIIKRILSSKAEFLYLPVHPEDAGVIIKQARENGLALPIMGSDEWKNSNIVEIAGAEALNNTFYTDHFSPEDTDRFVQEFVEDFQAKYNKIPDANAALGFDSVLLLADTIKFAEDKDPSRLMETLASTNGIELITGYIYLNDYHNPLKPGAIFEFKDGESVFKTRASH